MSFKFLDQINYEIIRQFAKDLYGLTGSLPAHETTGLISQIRVLANQLVTDYAESSVRISKSDRTEIADRSIVIISQIVSLIDLSFHLKYISIATHKHWMDTADDLTRRLYDSRKSK